MVFDPRIPDADRCVLAYQLEKWADRVGAEFVGGQKGGDPAAVAFDAIEAAENRGIDVVIVDTAGRLHTRNDLMQELQKAFDRYGQTEQNLLDLLAND